MRILSMTVAMLFAVATSSVYGFQAGPGDPGVDPPGGPSTGGGGGGTAVPWRFSNPNDGMESYGDVLFMGTGPVDSFGGLSVYSYTNGSMGGVYPSELQLQIAVIVDTDPGVDWVGPIYTQIGESYATIMPALGTPNAVLLSLVNRGGTAGESVDLGTLSTLSGGQGVLFRILEP